MIRIALASLLLLSGCTIREGTMGHLLDPNYACMNCGGYFSYLTPEGKYIGPGTSEFRSSYTITNAAEKYNRNNSARPSKNR